MVSFPIDFDVKSPTIWADERQVKVVLINIKPTYRSETSVQQCSKRDLLPIGHTLWVSDRRKASASIVESRGRYWLRHGRSATRDITSKCA
jgi:hypothetical protein